MRLICTRRSTGYAGRDSGGHPSLFRVAALADGIYEPFPHSAKVGLSVFKKISDQPIFAAFLAFLASRFSFNVFVAFFLSSFLTSFAFMFILRSLAG
jgi:hypothetical protein